MAEDQKSEEPEVIGRAGHAVDAGYRRQLASDEKTGRCAFCEPHIHTLKNKPIEPHLWEHWWLKLNDTPYPHQQHHFVMAAKKHLTNMRELNAVPGMMDELFRIVEWVQNKYQVEAGMVAHRFGPLSGSGGTMVHAHAHIHVADKTGPVVATVYLPDELRSRLMSGQSIYHPDWVPPVKTAA
ncbi:MAG: hypothetical protein V4526_02940 [Patescibacteria group bacterium]